MRILDLRLHLLDDLVASASSATEGGHESLDFIPGAMLLGAAAARLYRNLPRTDAYVLFHSGKLRFGDALPVASDGAPGFPVPLCWHHKKGEGAVDDHRIVRERVRNFQHGRFPDDAQPKQMRDLHVTEGGRVIKVDKALRMKTAIDPELGRIAEGQLFGYEAIRAGQTFHARIEADADVPDALWQRLLEVFAGERLLLGRSRSAEYGRVQVTVDASVSTRSDVGAPKGHGLTLWCLSDLALIDENGQPTLEPTPQNLGLGIGRVEWNKSFLRFRSYAPWNAHRRARDLERQVIRRGSVITLCLDEPLAAERLAALAAGIGLWREAGLGRVWVNPPLLAAEQPLFTEPTVLLAPATTSIARPNHPLVRWLEAQRQGASARQDAEKRARKLVEELRQRYQLARSYAGLPDRTPVGPSPSQWGSVLAKAKEASAAAALRNALFEGDAAICKQKGEGWQDQFRDDGELRSFRTWFQQKLPDDLDALRAFARRAVEMARREHGRGEPEEKSA